MKRLFLLGMLFVILTGCVDYTEELWLNKDGTGKAKLVIGVISSYENPEELNRYFDQPGISLISKSVSRKQNYTYYNLYFKFNSLEAFNNLNDQVSNADFFGRISVTKEADGTVTMNRRISLGSISSEDDEFEQLISKLSQGDFTWHYKMHLPWKVISSNADQSNIDFKNNVVSWQYQTAYLWNRPQTMTVTMKPTLPLLPLILIGLALVLIIISLIWWRRHVKKLLLKAESDKEQDKPTE